MSIVKQTYTFADYNCGTYGAGTYQGACNTSTTTGGGTGTNPVDTLANTGYDVLIPVFLGISLVGASAVMLVRKALRKRKQNTQQG